MGYESLIINFLNLVKHLLCVKQYIYLCFESEMLIWEVIQRSPHSVAKATEMALKTKSKTSDWLIQCRPTLDWSEFQGIHWRKIKALGNSSDARMLSLLQELPPGCGISHRNSQILHLGRMSTLVTLALVWSIHKKWLSNIHTWSFVLSLPHLLPPHTHSQCWLHFWFAYYTTS